MAAAHRAVRRIARPAEIGPLGWQHLQRLIRLRRLKRHLGRGRAVFDHNISRIDTQYQLAVPAVRGPERTGSSDIARARQQIAVGKPFRELKCADFIRPNAPP